MPIKETAVLMFGIQGKLLSSQETEWLNHPLTAGVILFSRNYESPHQLKSLIADIREKAESDILISVDHEGGRVQRFKEDFTRLPAMAKLGKIYDQNKSLAIRLARETAIVLGYELKQYDIDFSFAPVLDIQNEISEIIGDRAFHSDPFVISELAKSFYLGLRDVGMAAVGKHFPGHGNISADSHLELPIADFSWDELCEQDILPFKSLIADGIEALMPAHVLYRKVDGMPAGFSNLWLQNILRKKLGFHGCIISDDLDMAGAAAFGGILDRFDLAIKNCDLILVCNNEIHMQHIFEKTTVTADKQRQLRIEKLLLKPQIISDSLYQKAKTNLIEAKLIT